MIDALCSDKSRPAFPLCDVTVSVNSPNNIILIVVSRDEATITLLFTHAENVLTFHIMSSLQARSVEVLLGGNSELTFFTI